MLVSFGIVAVLVCLPVCCLWLIGKCCLFDVNWFCVCLGLFAGLLLVMTACSVMYWLV